MKQATRRAKAIRAKEASPSDGGAQETFSGAVLFTDIVDSTGLVRRCAAQGRTSTEALAEALGQYFSIIERTVSAWGGEVVRLDGDAVIALWRSGEDARAACTQACLAAVALEKVADWPDPLGLGPIRRRTAITCGGLIAQSLASRTGRNHIVLSGPPMSALASGALKGRPDEVLVSHEVADQALGFLFEPVNSTAARLTPQTRSTHQPHSTRPPPRAAEAVPASGWFAEFREVSAAFVRIPEATLSSSSGPLILAAFEAAEGALSSIGLALWDVVASDKGLVFILVCGAAPFTRENNASFAAAGAHILSSALRSLGFDPVAGVASGPVFFAEVGRPRRRERLALGAPLNYAARLMQGAADGVYCDRTTAHALADQFQFAPPIRLDSSTAEFPVFGSKLLGRRLTKPTPARTGQGMVARAAELERLAAALATAGSAACRPVLVEGEAGVGKSLLLEHCARAARSRGMLALTAAAAETERNSPFFVFRQVLAQRFSTELEAGGGALPNCFQRASGALFSGAGSSPKWA